MSASAKSSKFTFDTEFRDGSEIVSPAARARQKKTLTTEELETMCARAKEEGATDGHVKAAENINQTIAALVIAMRASLDQSRAAIEEVREEAAGIAFAAAKKIAAAALKALPAADVEEALRLAMHQAIAEPRITLRAAPEVAAVIKDRIEAIAQEEGYEGRAMVVADPAIVGADCRIEWRGAGSERSEAAIMAALDTLSERHFSHSDSPVLKG